MMTLTTFESRAGFPLAVAIALMVTSAQGEDRSFNKSEPEVVRVTAARPDVVIDTEISTNVGKTIEAVEQQVQRDLEKRLEAIGLERIELAIAAVPTRG